MRGYNSVLVPTQPSVHLIKIYIHAEWGSRVNQKWDATLLIWLILMSIWMNSQYKSQVVILVRWILVKFFWTWCKMDGLNKRMCRVFIVQIFLKLLICLNVCKFLKLLMKGLWNLLIFKLLVNILTVLVIASIWEENPTHQRFTQI